ncbi:MAG: hypothetical protein AAGB31_11490 [Bdellovibrio sp.]
MIQKVLPLFFLWTSWSQAQTYLNISTPLDFQSLHINTTGGLLSTSSDRWDLAGKTSTSTLYSSALPAKRSVEVLKNNNNILSAVVLKTERTDSDSVQADYIKFGKNSKVKSHTRCWNEKDCFTLTQEFCQQLPKSLGLKDLRDLQDRASACASFNSGFTQALEKISESTRMAQEENLKALSTTQSAPNKWTSLFKKDSSSDQKDLQKAIANKEMRQFQVIESCAFYQQRQAFENASITAGTGTNSAGER